MGEFFKGWRRKAGCGLLVMACGLAGAWMLSLTIRDQVVFPHHDEHSIIRYSQFESALGTVRWGRFGPPTTLDRESVEASNWQPPVWMRSALRENEDADHYWQEMLVEWRWNYGEFDFGAGVHQGEDGARIRIETWAVPYWSLVLPLTLLSAWLILRKPRKAKGGTTN